MRFAFRICALALLAASGRQCAGAEGPARPQLRQALQPSSALSLAAVLDRGSDPGPEEPPAFPSGYRPEPWQAWETPDPLRRGSLGISLGMAFYYADSIALKMDNPTLFDTGSEEVGYRSLWEGNAFSVSVEAGLALTPALSLGLQGGYCSFRHEVSPPSIYVIYTGPADNYRILSASDLVLGQVLVMGRFSLPFNQVATEPENLWKWREPSDPGGFIPFIALGAGVALFDACTVSVQRNEGGTFSSMNRDLYKRTVNLAVAGAVGLEYRFSFLSFEARFDGAHNGQPASAWSPYTNAAQALLTYRLMLSARILF